MSTAAERKSMNVEPSLAIASGVSGVVISRNRVIVRSQNNVAVLGDALRQLRMRRAQAEAVRELEDAGHHIRNVRPDQQRFDIHNCRTNLNCCETMTTPPSAWSSERACRR
jgi:hypothetical protein